MDQNAAEKFGCIMGLGAQLVICFSSEELVRCHPWDCWDLILVKRKSALYCALIIRGFFVLASRISISICWSCYNCKIFIRSLLNYASVKMPVVVTFIVRLWRLRSRNDRKAQDWENNTPKRQLSSKNLSQNKYLQHLKTLFLTMVF